ncbi:aminotransferase class I/II-fold pyridoxal phosphate-dependent enzyme [Thalassotalea sp. G2M2-11]|uniref:aminotransferase class I/II-fold pyridoxal phosphate-dependent enzyme n=1 Tax=Thalassotalea sp. G2M2-11 TaxID=2787627 RepID=UPI0019CF8421|nr:aminotransferase class I/II-fold pyridoxal phosphate-dependent enzyme [Thalassotalea sp. G2M2-11]
MQQNKFVLPAHLDFVSKLPCQISDNLSNSCAQSLTLTELCQLSGQGVEQFDDTPLSYAPLLGAESLRQQLVYFHQALNHHQTRLTADNVLTFCGAQEAIAAVYQSVLRPGDEVVVVSPSYPSLITMAKQLGCQVKLIELSNDNNWQLTINDFTQVVNKQTRLIVVNSPHNPTGQVIDSPLADEILQLAQQYQCYLLADDVSQASNYNQLALSHRYLDYDKAVVVAVLSKSFGLAGVRIGWALSQNKSLLQRLLAVKSYGSICGSVMDEQLAGIALKHHRQIINAANSTISDNIDLFEQFVKQHSQYFSWQPPQAGMLALVKIHTEQTIERWVENLAKVTGVLLLPANLFGIEGHYVRLGLGQQDFPLMLKKLSDFVTNQR